MNSCDRCSRAKAERRWHLAVHLRAARATPGEGDAGASETATAAGGAGEAKADAGQQVEHFASILRRTRAQRAQNYRPHAGGAEEEEPEPAKADSNRSAKRARSRSSSASSTSPTSASAHSAPHVSAPDASASSSLQRPATEQTNDISEQEHPPDSSSGPPAGTSSGEADAERDARSTVTANAPADKQSEAETAAERERQWLALFARQHTDAELLEARERYLERQRRREALPAALSSS